MNVYKPKLPILDPVHPLAQGLVGGYMLYEGAGSVAHGHNTRVNGAIESGVSWVVRESGIATKHNGASNTEIRIGTHFSLNNQPLTFVSRINLGDTNEHGAVIGLGDDSNGFKLGVGNNNLENNGNHLILLVDQEAWIDTNDAVGTGDHQISVAYTDGSNYRLAIDGATVHTGSENYRNPSNVSYLASGHFASRYFTDCIYFGLFYHRVLTEDELSSLWIDPYQMFLPSSRKSAAISASALGWPTGNVDVSVTWMDASENEDGFSLERRADGGAWAEIATPAIDDENYADVVLNGHTYTYRIKATSTALGDSEWSNEASITV